MPRVLTFNSHEAYVYDLARVGYPLDVVVDLHGHHHASWDTRLRPIPDNVRLLSLADARANRYDCIIAHNITDLLATKQIPGGRILTLHSSLHGRIEQEGASISADDPGPIISQYMQAIDGEVVVISEMKRTSWSVDATVITGAVDGNDYCGYTGEIPSGLRVANHVKLKERYLNWGLHEAIFAELPCRLVGLNPDLEDTEPAESWDELRALYRSHRFIVHTAAEEFEDGYNLALLEAMATGMPVVTNDHSTSPVVDGVHGFRSDDVGTLCAGVARLLSEPDLAREMGAAARERALAEFPMSGFVTAWRDVIARASARRA